MIKYAGYDPTEHVRIKSDRINVARGDELRRGGMSWRQVAAALSDEANRYPPFTWDSVQKAVRTYRKQKENER